MNKFTNNNSMCVGKYYKYYIHIYLIGLYEEMCYILIFLKVIKNKITKHVLGAQSTVMFPSQTSTYLWDHRDNVFPSPQSHLSVCRLPVATLFWGPMSGPPNKQLLESPQSLLIRADPCHSGVGLLLCPLSILYLMGKGL